MDDNWLQLPLSPGIRQIWGRREKEGKEEGSSHPRAPLGLTTPPCTPSNCTRIFSVLTRRRLSRSPASLTPLTIYLSSTGAQILARLAGQVSRPWPLTQSAYGAKYIAQKGPFAESLALGAIARVLQSIQSNGPTR